MSKIFVSFAIVLLVMTFFTSSSLFQDVCIPDGCTFSEISCSDVSCINETVSDHISERLSFFSVVVKDYFILFSVFLAGLIALCKHFKFADNLTVVLTCRFRLWHKRIPNLFNQLLLLFSSGILHPKIY